MPETNVVTQMHEVSYVDTVIGKEPQTFQDTVKSGNMKKPKSSFCI